MVGVFQEVVRNFIPTVHEAAAVGLRQMPDVIQELGVDRPRVHSAVDRADRLHRFSGESYRRAWVDWDGRRPSRSR